MPGIKKHHVHLRNKWVTEFLFSLLSAFLLSKRSIAYKKNAKRHLFVS